jgi:hypothetical protein
MFVIHTPLHSPFYAAHICLKWRQQQQSRVPDLPSVFAPPGFMIERISLRPVGYGAQIKIILFVLLPAA